MKTRQKYWAPLKCCSECTDLARETLWLLRMLWSPLSSNSAMSVTTKTSSQLSGCSTTRWRHTEERNGISSQLCFSLYPMFNMRNVLLCALLSCYLKFQYSCLVLKFVQVWKRLTRHARSMNFPSLSGHQRRSSSMKDISCGSWNPTVPVPALKICVSILSVWGVKNSEKLSLDQYRLTTDDIQKRSVAPRRKHERCLLHQHNHPAINK